MSGVRKVIGKPWLTWLLSGSVLLLLGVVVLQAVFIAHTRMISGQPLLLGQDHHGLAHHPSFSLLSESSATARTHAKGLWGAPPHLSLLEEQVQGLLRSMLVEVESNQWARPEGGMPVVLDRIRRTQAQVDTVFQRLSDDFVHLTPPAAFDSGWETAIACPALAFREDASNYVVTVDLPGLDRTNIAVYMEERDLTVLAETDTSAETVEAGGIAPRSEYRRIERRIRMPGPIDTGQVPQARYEDGRLTVAVAKGPPEAVEVRQVRVQ